MCFYYFYIISPYSKNTIVNFEAFRWNIPSSINLFFLENMSQKVEMVWSVDQICQTKVFRFWFWNFKTLFCSLIFNFLEHFWRFVRKNLLGKFVVNKIISFLGSVISWPKPQNWLTDASLSPQMIFVNL